MRSRAFLALLAVSWFLIPRASFRAADGLSDPRRSSSAIALTGDGVTLLVVNPDSNSLTLVDTDSHAVLDELPVGMPGWICGSTPPSAMVRTRLWSGTT